MRYRARWPVLRDLTVAVVLLSTVPPVNSIRLIDWKLSFILRLPFGHLFTALIASVAASFRSRAALQLEILALRHQIGVLQRSVKRPRLTPADRFLWVWLCTIWREWKSGVFIMQASTVLSWHRKGFRLFWTWKIRRGKPGRPSVPMQVRELIRTMSRETRSGELHAFMASCSSLASISVRRVSASTWCGLGNHLHRHGALSLRII